MPDLNWFPPPEDRLTGLFGPYRRAVRVEFDGATVADSPDVMLLRDGHLQGQIHYMFSEEELREDRLEATGRTEDTDKGVIKYRDVVVGDTRARDAAFAYPDTPVDDRPNLRGYVGFHWSAMDAWFEEGQRVYKHPRDPYHRIDTLQSSRRVEVKFEGITLADTPQPTFLLETGHPRRYYVPREDVLMDLLTRSESRWHCPYKGDATYWTLQVGDVERDDLAWSYPEPMKDAAEVEGMIGFYNEKLDVFVEGELEGRPVTRFAG